MNAWIDARRMYEECEIVGVELVNITRRIKPTAAIDARITEGLDTDYELYKLINKKPGRSIYDLAKEKGWSSGKVHGSVQRLEKEGLVHIERATRGGRTILKVHAADWSEFFTPEELKEFESLEF